MLPHQGNRKGTKGTVKRNRKEEKRTQKFRKEKSWRRGEGIVYGVWISTARRIAEPKKRGDRTLDIKVTCRTHARGDRRKTSEQATEGGLLRFKGHERRRVNC